MRRTLQESKMLISSAGSQKKVEKKRGMLNAKDFLVVSHLILQLNS